jgi:hypothetical protein
MDAIEFALAAPNELPVSCFIRSAEPDQAKAQVFLDCVRALWTKLPEADRTAIAKCCNRTQSPLTWYLEVGRFSETDTLGRFEACGDLTREFKFDWNTVKDMAPTALTALIAHEMAHLYQLAIGKTRATLQLSDLEGTILEPNLQPVHPEGLVEVHADEIVKRWGFCPLEPLIWFHQHFRVRKGRQEPREKAIQRKSARDKAHRTKNAHYRVLAGLVARSSAQCTIQHNSAKSS